MTKKLSSISVFYTAAMLAKPNSFSPSAQKPEHVVAAWHAAALPLAVNAVTAATEHDLCLAHDPAFIRGVLGETVANGFGDTSSDVAASLPYTNGAMIDAARSALQGGIACAPVSGFHHAGYDHAGGYCTFNGLVVTARKLLAEGILKRVLILDCDMHYGDGTDAIITRLHLKESIHNATFGRWFHESAQAKAYLERLRETVGRFELFDLVLYQAGADVHINDPLGGVLSTTQMIERDRIVFTAAHGSGTPIAWNLAGGYQEPLSKVVELHVNTMRECVRAYIGSDGPVTAQ
jgi:acetoin utilization deacetylase AcuC-like enzyme